VTFGAEVCGAVAKIGLQGGCHYVNDFAGRSRGTTTDATRRPTSRR